METKEKANGDPRKATETAAGRITRWTQKLLDFSARNRLLNIPKSSRQVMRLLCPDVAALEDLLADAKAIPVRSVLDAMSEKALKDYEAGKLDRAKCVAVAADEFAKRRLCTLASPKEVKRQLTELMHAARTGLEESGLNTLFLTFGEVQWMERGEGAGRKAYRAPILLMPVRLTRASMADGVKLSRLDEETTINTTLVEFLRAEFGIVPKGLDPLPLDEHGVDVGAVLGSFREAIAACPGWEVCEEATLGCYSFGKFVMWKDMTERGEELKRNPLVSHLVGGGGLFDDGVKVFPPEEIAGQLQLGKLYCPVNYDASQLTAVLYSALGKTFVLHGPPGTGKSQTITNIIAHNLALGRRVLFVSEKKAALDVVKDRLDRIGLSPFCLELHSNKTEKAHFYGQIKEALESQMGEDPADWQRSVDDLERCRRELNAYVTELHRPYPNGLSAYDCLERTIGCAASHPEFISIDCRTQTREQYEAMRETVRQLLLAFRGVSPEALKVTPELRADSWTPTLDRQIQSESSALAAALAALRTALDPLLSALGVSRPPSLALAESLAKDLAAIASAGGAPLASYRLDRLAEIDFDGVAKRLEENAAAFCLIRFFRNRALLGELGDVRRPGGERLTVERLSSDLPALAAYAGGVKRLAALTGRRPVDGDSLPPAVRDGLPGLQAGVRDARAAFDRFLQLAELSPDEPLDELERRCRALADGAGDVRGVLRWRQVRKRADELGAAAFADFISAEDDGRLDADALFDGAYSARMLEAIVSGNKVFSEFNGLGREALIDKFRALDARHRELSRQAVIAKLQANQPLMLNVAPLPKDSELGLIRRECEKKTRQKAVRQLLREASDLVSRLKPCFLMSPLSVAQYLPVSSKPFDLVVFDEASQIPVWDAIGVIARGRQLVVVGDPKQMPPTSFFQKGEAEDDEDEAEEEVIEDQESILDECLVAGVHSSYLSWHYRSRHESLIAFSNEHYYGGRLFTFPAAASTPRLGVKFVFVEDGRFVRQGKSSVRVNEREARALVDYVCERVLEPGYKRRSVGIVTFSIHQQKLIRALLEERRAADARLEQLLPEEGEGAYFVKNLENVQGDESDVILFSVGYAPDENGKFTMNFGPLNLAGGERRLNVAVTRAKEQVVVFSSIRGAQIDAGEGGRTQALGAADLKAFLDYAERGATAPTDAAAATSIGFGAVVAAFLASRGYTVERQVGRSGCRIDVAVRHPQDPSRYLAGILCDGPDYARANTAQDRELNRAGVLSGLGWTLLRAWSVDWAFDRAKAEERLLGQLKKLERTAASKQA